MIFGVLKDIKEGENRVICTPVEVASIVAAGHTVLVEKGAGVGAGFADEKYAAMGAKICDTAKELWDTCDFLAKVKEIEPSEFGYLKENQMIYCCIHPAGHPEEVQAILDSMRASICRFTVSIFSLIWARLLLCRVRAWSYSWRRC